MSVGYVMEGCPLSETSVVEEILAHERAGVTLELFSLRRPSRGAFHESVARVRAPVRYLAPEPARRASVWSLPAGAAPELARLWGEMDELIAVEVGDALQAVELARIVRRGDIEHLHARSGAAALAVASLAARLAGVGYSFAAGSGDLAPDRIESSALRAMLEDARDVVAVSDSALDRLRRVVGPAADRARRVYAGLDVTDLAYREPPARPVAVVAVGSLVDGNGFDDLVDACAVLACTGRSVDCRIVGAGPLEDDLRRHAAAHGLGDLVAVTGRCPEGRVVEELMGAAVLVAPSVAASDGAEPPTAVLQAMALGTAVVATTVPGVREAVRDEETGLLVPPGDPARLADAIHRLVADADQRVRLTRSARRLVEEEFDADRQAARLRRGFANGSRPTVRQRWLRAVGSPARGMPPPASPPAEASLE